ncbi:hypothetical protein MNBD_GAMMA06-1457 [hydrothermal vent metagenome]|uniref:Type II secretion system protein GspB C-terminal domain-containing protein n=1 Tax=hydrothermal vent metagenome TaxID=652676 RepID=A0A3B0X0V7_9ZZZZ
MSYILDALKKSEQERGKGNIPGIQTVHSSSLNYRREKTNYWQYILVAVVILNLLAIIYYLAEKDTPTETNIAAQQTASETLVTKEKATAPVVVQSGEISAPEKNTSEETPKEIFIEQEKSVVDNKNIDKINTQTNITTNTEASHENIPTINDETTVIDFHELPDSIKQVLPVITISAHVYSSNPMQRSIVINNDFMEEGEHVLDGLILYEITDNGAIFNYEGTLFSYAVVSGWQ